MQKYKEFLCVFFGHNWKPLHKKDISFGAGFQPEIIVALNNTGSVFYAKYNICLRCRLKNSIELVAEAIDGNSLDIGI